MKKIRYTSSWFETDSWGNSMAKYQAGKTYLVTDETLGHVARGIAEEVEVPDEPADTAADAAESPAESPDAAPQDASKPARTRKA